MKSITAQKEQWTMDDEKTYVCVKISMTIGDRDMTISQDAFEEHGIPAAFTLLGDLQEALAKALGFMAQTVTPPVRGACPEAQGGG